MFKNFFKEFPKYLLAILLYASLFLSLFFSTGASVDVVCSTVKDCSKCTGPTAKCSSQELPPGSGVWATVCCKPDLKTCDLR